MTYLFEEGDHAVLREQVGRFARLEIQPHASAWEESESFPRELYRLAGTAGILGIGYPEAYGGTGGNLSHAVVAAEALLLEGTTVGTCVGLGSHSIVLPLILRFGTEDQKLRFVPRVLSGDAICSLAVTEPGGGSDVAALRTAARSEGEDLVVSGSKTFITSGTRADFVLTAVRTGVTGHGGISLVVIEAGTPGFTVSKELKKMGWRASDTAELFFDECRVPKENVLGEVDAGFLGLMSNFATERILLAAQCVAIGELALREAKAYANDRTAFGKALAGFQVTRHKLADMATRIAAARAITGETVIRYLRGEDVTTLAAKAKNASTDMCEWVASDAVQIFGGAGYLRGVVVERLFRDARLYAIGGGTREIMNEIISKFDR